MVATHRMKYFRRERLPSTQIHTQKEEKNDASLFPILMPLSFQPPIYFLFFLSRRYNLQLTFFLVLCSPKKKYKIGEKIRRRLAYYTARIDASLLTKNQVKLFCSFLRLDLFPFQQEERNALL